MPFVGLFPVTPGWICLKPAKMGGAMKEIEPLVDTTTLRKTYPVSKRTVGRWIKKGCPSKLIEGRRLWLD